MKTSLAKFWFLSMAIVCLVGSLGPAGLLSGQQLQPLPRQPANTPGAEDSRTALPPVVSGSGQEPADRDLPPVYSVSQMMPLMKAETPARIAEAPRTGTVSTPEPASVLPPIISSASRPAVAPQAAAPQTMAPPVAAQAAARPMGAPRAAANQSSGPPVAAPPGAESPANAPLVGRNFPADARQKIEQFKRDNQFAISQTPGLVPSQYPTAVPGFTPGAALHSGFQQESSPSDVPRTMVPDADPSRPAINPPATNSPSVTPRAFSAPPAYLPPQAAVVQQGPVPGQDPFFESPQNYDAAGDFGGETWSPAGIEYGSIDDTFACCGFVTDSSGYFVFDSLIYQRGDGDFRAGNFLFPDSFDWSGGGRVTLGKRRDCTRGWEASYMGFDPWLSVTNETNPPGTLLGAIFGSVDGFPDSTFSAFRNATFLEQFQKTDLHSLEFNQTWWGSDVAKAFLGGRFIYFDDEFRLSSQNILGEVGIHTINTTNNMFGIHIGSEVLYDIGYRLSFSVAGKLGVYANFWEGRTALLNNNTIWINATRRSTDWGGSAELGAFARYKLGPRSRLRFGYQIMGLANVYDTESNFNPVVLPTAGQQYNDGGAFFHGASFGLEIFR